MVVLLYCFIYPILLALKLFIWRSWDTMFCLINSRFKSKLFFTIFTIFLYFILHIVNIFIFFFNNIFISHMNRIIINFLHNFIWNFINLRLIIFLLILFSNSFLIFDLPAGGWRGGLLLSNSFLFLINIFFFNNRSRRLFFWYNLRSAYNLFINISFYYFITVLIIRFLNYLFRLLYILNLCDFLFLNFIILFYWFAIYFGILFLWFILNIFIIILITVMLFYGKNLRYRLYFIIIIWVSFIFEFII